MSNTSDEPRELRDEELDGVSGGYVYHATYVLGVSVQTKTTTACTRMATPDVCGGGNYTLFLPDGTP